MVKGVQAIFSCWQIEISSGKMICFTNCDSTVNIKGDLYHPLCSDYYKYNTSSSVLIKQILIDNNVIIKNDIDRGLYIKKIVRSFFIDINNPDDKIMERVGLIKRVMVDGNMMTIEVDFSTSVYDYPLTENYSRVCRAVFGDERCMVNKEKLSYLGTVDNFINMEVIIDNNITNVNNYWKDGYVVFLTGKMSGKSIGVRSNYNSCILLSKTVRDEITKGDSYRIYPGCDKSINTCFEKFNNTINFRGEPYIPEENLT